MSYSSANTITTVARREIQVAAKSKGILASVIITLVLIVGGIIGLSIFIPDSGSDGDGPSAGPSVAVVDSSVLAGSGLEATEVADRGAATAAVRDGEVDAALLPGDQGWELLADGTPSGTVSMLADEAVRAFETNQALGELGVDPEAFAGTMGPTQVTAVDVSATGDDGEMGTEQLITVVISLVGVALLMFAIILFAANIGSRVTEEKSSRVVELILASVRPLDFLAGKIIGNVLFGLACTLVLVIAGAVTLSFSGLIDGMSFDWTIVPVLLVSFILGMIFFGSLYAAAGAMVQRTEDLQSTQGPIMILIFATLYIPAFGWGATDATWMQVMGWVPPISIGAAPLQYAAGNMSLLEFGLSMLIMTVATFGAVWLVSRIYRAAILNNGQKLTWMKALRARPA